MKRRYAAITLGIVLSLSTMNVYAAEEAAATEVSTMEAGGSEAAEENTGETEEEKIYGEVTAIEENVITIKTISMNMMQPGEAPQGEAGEEPQGEAGEAPQGEAGEESQEESVEEPQGEAGEESQTEAEEVPQGEPEADGEEMQINITEETVIKKQTMSMENQPGGDGGEMPEMPDGGDGEAPEKPDEGNGASGEGGDTMEALDGSNGEMPGGGNGEGGGANGEMPDGGNGEGGGANGEMPEMPGEANEETGESGDVMEALDGANGGAPEMPGGGMGGNQGMMGGSDMFTEEEISLEDIAEGDTVQITLDENGDAAEILVMSMEMGGAMGAGGMGGQPGGMGGMSSGVDSYDAVNDYTEDIQVSDETFTSTGTDENAIHVSEGASAVLKNITVTRESSESQGGDNSSFYGVGAAILTTDGTSYISGSTVETNASGGAGIFAYGDGVVYTSDTEITTEQDTSGGIHAAGGGTLYAWDMDVETSGESAAAIRSDRGGGTMVVDGGTYVSNGVGSPAIYSTADISVNNADLTANGSEAVCIEGLNSLHLFDCNLTGSMQDLDQNDCTWNVILYQSMSGDSEVGNSTFEMNGGILTAQNGGMFYTTNTESTFILSNVEITNAADSEFFLKCTGNSNQRGWGQSGQNGADCHFTASSQKMEGNVIWDSISQLDFYMTNGSTLTGAVTDDESNAGEGGEGYCSIYISEDSTWTVTGDSTLTNLYCAGTIVDENGSAVTVQGIDGTVYVEGDSTYTITVTTYEASADLSGASEPTSWSNYQVEKPEELA